MPTSLRTIILATAVLTVAAPAAQASPLGADGHAVKILQLRHIAPPPAIAGSDVAPNVIARHTALGRLTPPVHRVAPLAGTSSGFDWTAAAIGAAIAGVLLIALGAGALGRTRRLATGQ